MPRVPVRRTYLELRDPADLRPARPLPPGATVQRIGDGAVGTFRALYERVGERWHWRDRLAWSDERLAEHLGRPDVELWVLWARPGEEGDDGAAGFFELERHPDASVEIVYFGLAEPFIGQGLGGALLAAAVERAWAMGASRVWLHTCTLDAPQALPNYEARGFRRYRDEVYEAELP
jgi:GNAT superfamily N-acetyltransferase